MTVRRKTNRKENQMSINDMPTELKTFTPEEGISWAERQVAFTAWHAARDEWGDQNGVNVRGEILARLRAGTRGWAGR